MGRHRYRSNTIQTNPSNPSQSSHTESTHNIMDIKEQLNIVKSSIHINHRILETQNKQINNKRNILVEQNNRIRYNDELILEQAKKNQQFIDANEYNGKILEQQAQMVLQKYGEIGQQDQRIFEQTKKIEEQTELLKTLETQLAQYQQQIASYHNTLSAFSLISQNPHYFGQMANMCVALNTPVESTVQNTT
jgi:uncharacterized protein (DUF3084 family)